MLYHIFLIICIKVNGTEHFWGITNFLLDTLSGFCPRYLRREGVSYIGSATEFNIKVY